MRQLSRLLDRLCPPLGPSGGDRDRFFRPKRPAPGLHGASANLQGRGGSRLVSVWYTFLLLCDSGVAASGDWVGGLQWIALLYRHSSRKCAARRRPSPKPKKESHRPRLNLPRVRAPNPLSLGRLSQSVATQDGWQPAERPPPPGFFRKRRNSERARAARRNYSRPRSQLRAAGAMIGKESAGLDGGWGVAKTGTCSWGRAGPNPPVWRRPA